MRDRINEMAYLAAWRTVRLMPEGLADRLFRYGADRAVRKGGKSVDRLRSNLSRVVGSPASDELVRDAMRSYARYWKEAFRLPSMSGEQQDAAFQMNGFDPVAEDSLRGRGSIIALPHMGNWDLAGAWAARNGYGVTAAAERLKPEGVFQRFLEYREQLGMTVVPTNGTSRPPLQILGDRLLEGDVIALVADRDLSERGIKVDFFDGTASFPVGPAYLAVRHDRPLYTAEIHYEGPRAVCHISGPVDTGTGPFRDRLDHTTQELARAFEKSIAAYPADWHMLQRFWVD
ncbi:phosphatidylinositol mannoside acyltransferase [Salininema proteolyticum]|uniref:Phosphatidylinositol mannoside acyltransferase n=1 Tax=Salininema proteolyticum TaxID=1607685 RepID=A0ABV8U550_9ACTN